jgi:hypothetical protein
MVEFADGREELFNGGFASDVEDVTLRAGRQLSNRLVDLGFAAGGNDNRCAFPGRGLGRGKPSSPVLKIT